LILRPTNDNAQFMQPMIVNRFPNPDLNKNVACLSATAVLSQGTMGS